MKSLIGRTAKLNFHLLDPTTVELAEQRGKLPPGTFKVQNADPTAYEKQFVVKRVLLTGDRLVNVITTVDPQSGKYGSRLNLTEKAQKNSLKLQLKIPIKDLRYFLTTK